MASIMAIWLRVDPGSVTMSAPAERAWTQGGVLSTAVSYGRQSNITGPWKVKCVRMPSDITSFVASLNTSLPSTSYPEDANLIVSRH